MDSSNIVLQTHHLQKKYGALQAVEDVSLTVRKGDVFGFLGPNGAGKTTTISMILGLTRPTRGEVRVLERRVTPQKKQILRQVGALVGAIPGLIPYLSARENLRLMSQLYPQVSSQRVDEVLELVGLQGVGKRPTAQFSTGMKQRLGMGLAILHQPQLLVLDEPTNGMDPAGMQEMRQIILQLAKEGVTIFLSSHLLNEVEQVCNRIAVLHQGKLVAQGAIAELRGEEKNVRVKAKDLDAVEKVLQGLPTIPPFQRQEEAIDITGLDSEWVIQQLVEHQVYPAEVFYTGYDLERLFLELTQKAQG
ncbi:ABC transporter ATP-binding protein [Spirulina subsalsa FACHB-351]|uniref:ABC transporter ATP-binding protein n=1 Tax=Spirulina subsalsa FACHB-351 TaxID=234711 RepID=A0ABT3L195_9CYAN|nr:ABC transporter ATP-binding protein [Spirulina subsalsa]MCW6035271.1 ABC transporter ATP-binding protein [Spirulina subsalsa FACHB-351]